MGFTTAASILQQRSQNINITTGSKAFDDILDGGTSSCSLIELFPKSPSFQAAA